MPCEFLTFDCLLLSPIAILISASIGGGVAVWAIFTNRKIARLKNSMDIMNNYQKDSDIRLAVAEIGDLTKHASNHVQSLAHDINNNTAHIRKVLNYFESIAVCVDAKIYDDKIIKKTMYSTVVAIWDTCLPYVEERRKLKGKPTFYQELESMVKRWKENPLTPKSKKRFLFF